MPDCERCAGEGIMTIVHARTNYARCEQCVGTGTRLTERQREACQAMLDNGAVRDGGRWVTAQQIGEWIRLPPVIRHGRQAHGPQSWSGYQAEGFVLGTTMRSLVRKRVVHETPDPRDPRPKSLYRLPA
jgi:hypothetical protein